MTKKTKILFIAVSLISAFVLNSARADKSYARIRKLIFKWQTEKAKEEINAAKDCPPEIKGLYSFYTGNYEEARKKFKKNPEAYPNLYKIAKEIKPVRAKFEITESRYFRIYASGKDRIMALYLGEILDSAVEKLEEYFNYKPGKEKIMLEIYPDRDSFQIASTLTDKHMKASGAVGICKFNRLMVTSPSALKFGYSWVDTIVHEYVHYIIGKTTGLSNMPLWLNEGLARNFEIIWRKEPGFFTPDEENRLYTSRQKEDWVPLQKMRHGMPSLENRDEVSLAFAQVHSMAHYLIDGYGFKEVGKFLYSLYGKKPDQVFKKEIGLSQKEFFNRWQDYIKKKNIKYTPGAAGANFSFKDEPVSAVSEWVSSTASTDIYLAQKFLNRGKKRLAKRKYEDALRKDPGNSVILNKLATLQIKTGEENKAETNLKKAIKNNPSYAPPYKHLSGIYFKNSDYQKAEKFMKKYIYRQPYDPEAHKKLSDIYENMKEDKLKNREERVLELIREG